MRQYNDKKNWFPSYENNNHFGFLTAYVAFWYHTSLIRDQNGCPWQSFIQTMAWHLMGAKPSPGQKMVNQLKHEAIRRSLYNNVETAMKPNHKWQNYAT